MHIRLQEMIVERLSVSFLWTPFAPPLAAKSLPNRLRRRNEPARLSPTAQQDVQSEQVRLKTAQSFMIEAPRGRLAGGGCLEVE